MRLRLKLWCCTALALAVPLAQATPETVFLHEQDVGQRHFARMHGDPASAAGAYLCARFAMSVGDLTIAADQFLVALQAHPRDPLIYHQALDANLLADRPMTQLVARQVARIEPGDPIAELVLAGEDVAAARWTAAVQHYAIMSPDGALGLMRKPLLAWAQFAGGRPDALATLLGRAGGRIDAVGGEFLYQAGLMADLQDHPDDAERFYIAARADLGSGDLALARALASVQARQGHLAAALKTLAAARDPAIQLDASMPRLQSAVAARPVNDAGDAIAGIYLAFALLAREHDAIDLSDMLFRLALTLRPHLTIARLHEAAAFASEGRAKAALATLAPIQPADPLWPSADRLRANLQPQKP